MKAETKKILFFLFLTVTYFTQAINNAFKFSFVYFFGFMLAVALLYVIRNKYIGTVIGLIPLLAMEFYNTDYKQLTVVAFLLICAHKNLITDTDNNKTNVFSFVLVQLSIFATVALFIYDFILIAKYNPVLITGHFSRTVLIFGWFIGMLLYSFSENKKDNRKKSSRKIGGSVASSLRFIYLVSIFGFAATVLFYQSRTGYLDISNTAIFFPWFVYICSTVYNGDPYVGSLTESISDLFTEIAYKDKVRK